MAIGTLRSGGNYQGGTQPVIPVSNKGAWVQSHDDCTAGEAASQLLKPWGITTSSVHWVRVPDNCTRVYVRGKNTATMSGVTTQPVVWLIGAYVTSYSETGINAVKAADGFSGTTTDNNHATYVRIDNVDSNATGLTLNIATTGNFEDSTFEYTDWTSIDGYDLKGCHYVATPVATAASILGIGAVVYCELMFL